MLLDRQLNFMRAEPTWGVYGSGGHLERETRWAGLFLQNREYGVSQRVGSAQVDSLHDPHSGYRPQRSCMEVDRAEFSQPG